MNETLIAEILVGFIGPVVIGLLFRSFEHQRNRKNQVTETYQRYNSVELLKARAVSWEFLSGHYAEDPQPWSVFYSDRAVIPGVNREPFWEAHDYVVQVGTFWSLLGVLAQQGEVDVQMAKALFQKPYGDWAVALRHLRRVTLAAGETVPDWLEALPDLDRFFCEGRTDLPDELPVLKRRTSS